MFLQGAGSKFDAYFTDKSPAADGFQDVANPPAKSIRFEGQETVLGVYSSIQISPKILKSRLADLLADQKYWSARQLVLQQRGAAEELIWSAWTDAPVEPWLAFVAQTLSENCQTGVSWRALLDSGTQQAVSARAYVAARMAFQQAQQDHGLNDSHVDTLRESTAPLSLPLAQIDTLRLIADHEFSQARQSWGEALLLQAIQLAESHQDFVRSAELRLELCRHLGRSTEENVRAAEIWQAAVRQHLQARAEISGPLRVGFWIAAWEAKPLAAKWPQEAIRYLLQAARQTGCRLEPSSRPDLIVRCALGELLLSNGWAQLALLQFKAAEGLAVGSEKQWLRVAQAQCLASLQQLPAAAAVLSTLFGSEDKSLAAAATAAMGSAKLEVGAFQQGASLLAKALADTSLEWPKRTHAEADLALAQVIMGASEQGFRALHAVQQNYEARGDRKSLLQSLENEARLLELEEDPERRSAVQQRIRELEDAGGTRSRLLAGSRRDDPR